MDLVLSARDTRVRLTESPLSTTPAGAPVIDTDGTPKSSEPAFKGGIEASGGEVSGTGTNPAATLAATSDPAVPPIAFPIVVSRPAALYAGPSPPENRPIGLGSLIEQSTTRQTPALAMSAITATVFWKSLVQWRLIWALPDVATQWTTGPSEIASGVGFAGVVSVKLCDEPDESHSIGRTGAPLAPVT